MRSSARWEHPYVIRSERISGFYESTRREQKMEGSKISPLGSEAWGKSLVGRMQEC